MGKVTVAPDSLRACATVISKRVAASDKHDSMSTLPDLSALALECETIGAGGDSEEEDDPALLEILRRTRGKRPQQSAPPGETTEPTPASRDGGDSEEEDDPALLEILRRSRGKRPQQSAPPGETTEPTPASRDGFVLKKRLCWSAPQCRAESMLDFMFENPLDGKFKDISVVKQLLNDFPGVVRQYNTSYCNYGYSYQKRTVLLGTLTQLKLKPPCPEQPCRYQSLCGKHPDQVAECDNAQKNSLPPLLIDAIVDGWVARHGDRAEQFLLIDVFSGWGSIEQRVASKRANGAWSNVFTFANDKVKGRGEQSNFDMSADQQWNPGTLLFFALRALWPQHSTRVDGHPRGALGWVQDNRVAVLFHCSTPCQTYSTNALATHRVKGTADPKTPQAEHDDAMNASLIGYFTRNLLDASRHAARNANS